ncbi:putative potentiating neddylation domain-containing protein [Dioscorea sansibarensis]
MNAWPCQLDDLVTWHTTLPHEMSATAAGRGRHLVLPASPYRLPERPRNSRRKQRSHWRN